MTALNKQALREAAKKAKELGNISRYTKAMIALLEFKEAATPDAVLALLDELEAAQNRSVELPSFDGYVPHIAKELHAAFKIACAAAGISVKGE